MVRTDNLRAAWLSRENVVVPNGLTRRQRRSAEDYPSGRVTAAANPQDLLLPWLYPHRRSVPSSFLQPLCFWPDARFMQMLPSVTSRVLY